MHIRVFRILTILDCESDDELSTGVAVAVSIVVTFIITLVVTALITYVITSLMCKHEPKQNKDQPVDVNDEQRDLHHNPSYENLILKESDPNYALPTFSNEMDTNPAYENTSTMDANPAYASINM